MIVHTVAKLVTDLRNLHEEQVNTVPYPISNLAARSFTKRDRNLLLEAVNDSRKVHSKPDEIKIILD